MLLACRAVGLGRLGREELVGDAADTRWESQHSALGQTPAGLAAPSPRPWLHRIEATGDGSVLNRQCLGHGTPEGTLLKALRKWKEVPRS